MLSGVRHTGPPSQVLQLAVSTHLPLQHLRTCSCNTHALGIALAGVGKSAFALMLIGHLAKNGYRVLYSFQHELLGRLLIRFDFKEGTEPEVEAARDDGNLPCAWLASVWASVKRLGMWAGAL